MLFFPLLSTSFFPFSFSSCLIFFSSSALSWSHPQFSPLTPLSVLSFLISLFSSWSSFYFLYYFLPLFPCHLTHTHLLHTLVLALSLVFSILISSLHLPNNLLLLLLLFTSSLQLAILPTLRPLSLSSVLAVSRFRLPFSSKLVFLSSCNLLCSVLFSYVLFYPVLSSPVIPRPLLSWPVLSYSN